jgi:hypothetical protein
MRNMLGTAVAVALSMMVLPNCCSTANADMSLAVSVGASAGYPENDYDYEDCDDEAMDWDNAIILNDNLIGFWVLLPSGTWALRCRSMCYNSGTLEWAFGPWWYDNSISYGCHCQSGYTSYYCPFHSVRFHTYMNRNYRNWHKRYFAYSHNRYQPRIERHIVVNRGRYVRHEQPVISRTHSVERTPQCHTATTERSVTITRERDARQPVRIDGGNRPERIDTHKGNSRQTEMTRTRTTTREHSNGCGNNSTTRTRSDTRSTTRTHGGR